MTYNPSSQIYLCDVPFTKSHADIIDFTSQNDQLNYFKSRVNKTYNDYVYVKKDNMIKVEGNLDELVANNYLFYKNPSSGKYYYCFIDRMEYISENTTGIYFTTDAWQTWFFDIQYMPSFIERKHVTNDTIGANTVPEGLETGEYICNSHVIDDHLGNMLDDLTYILSLSVDMNTIDLGNKTIEPSGVRRYNGIISGTAYYRLDFSGLINTYLEELTEIGNISAINGLFMAPKELAQQQIDEVPKRSPNEIKESNAPAEYNNTIAKNYNLNGYTPKNNKLYVYPYNFLVVSNNQGTSQIMRYEDFNSSSCNFKIQMCITPGCSIRMIPLNFKNITENDDYGINMGKLPVCSYNVDMYTNWLTQNSINVGGTTITSDQVNVANNVLSGFGSSLGSLITGNLGGVVGGLQSTFTSTYNSLLQTQQHNMLSGVSGGNLNSGDVVTASNKNTFHFYKMSVRSEFAKIIDDYFSKYGYKVNRVETPKVRTRQNWNYLKTIGFNLKGNIPQTEMEEIKAMFDGGVTIWHNPNTIYDYSQSNGII